MGPKDAEGLSAFKDALGKKKDLARLVVLYGGKEARTLSGDCIALPWGWLFPRLP